MSHWNRNGKDWTKKYFYNNNERIEPWDNPPKFDDSLQTSNNLYVNNNRKNFFNQDRYRQRDRYDNYDRNDRARGRRCSSAPRSLNDTFNEPNINWNNRNNKFRRSRRNSSCQNDDFSDNDPEENDKNNSPVKNIKQLKGFKSIFSDRKIVDNISIKKDFNSLVHTDTTRSKRIVYEIKNKQIINNNNEKSDKPIINNNNKAEKIKKEIKNNDKNKDIIKYFGNSLSNNVNTDLKVELPIVEWPKKSFTMDNIPEYNNDIVGGDGITIELYYMCKYCCLFTDHSQINNHLKSRYHYDKYVEYLKNGYVVSDSSSLSSNESNISKDNQDINNKNILIPSTNNQSISDMDSNDLLFNVHEELDYNEDTD